MLTIEKYVPTTHKRVWGEEIFVAQTDDYLGKVLRMRAGTAGGLQLHRRKDETFHLWSGEAYVDYDLDGDLVRVKMVAGESYRIPPGAPHRVEAITDCVFFETGNAVYDDRQRLEEHYDVPVIGDAYGLPTTQ